MRRSSTLSRGKTLVAEFTTGTPVEFSGQDGGLSIQQSSPCRDPGLTIEQTLVGPRGYARGAEQLGVERVVRAHDGRIDCDGQDHTDSKIGIEIPGTIESLFECRGDVKRPTILISNARVAPVVPHKWLPGCRSR